MEKIVVRLFYVSGCSGGCCGCGPSKDAAAFEEIAVKLVEKFGEEKLAFEAYTSLDLKKFPFLRKAANPAGKIAVPLVAVGEKVFEPGNVPGFSDLEKEVGKLLKKVG